MRWLKRALCAALCLLMALGVGVPARAEDAEAGVTLTRECSGLYAARGDWVTLSYTVRNELEQAISDVTVSDSLLGEVGYAARLEPGKSKLFLARVRVTDECESRPSVTYEAKGRKRNVQAAAQTIRPEEAAISAALSCEAGDEGVCVRLVVTNQGNSPVTGVKATDRVLGDMGASVAVIEPGASAEFVRTARPGQSGVACCEVTAASGSGRIVTVASNEAEIEGAARESGGALSMEVTADGAVGCVISLNNPTATTLRDARLKETASGAERIIRFLPAGSVTEVLWTAEPGLEELRFELILPDGSSLGSRPVAMDGSEARLPAEEPGVPVMTGPSLRVAENPQTYRTMMLAAGGVLAGLAALGWTASAIRRRMEKRRRARRKQEMRRQRVKSRKAEEKRSEVKKT